MRCMSSFLAGAIFGAALLYTSMRFHLIRAEDGFHMVAKVQARLPDAYVDVRGFGVGDWTERPELAAAVGRSDKRYLLGNSATGALNQAVNQALDAWQP